jgi:hypothetical protein
MLVWFGAKVLLAVGSFQVPIEELASPGFSVDHGHRKWLVRW